MPIEKKLSTHFALLSMRFYARFSLSSWGLSRLSRVGLAALMVLCLTASAAFAACKTPELPDWFNATELESLLGAEEAFDPKDPDLPYSEGEKQGIACTVFGLATFLGAYAVGAQEFITTAGGGTTITMTPGPLALSIFSAAYASGCAVGGLLEPILVRWYEDITYILPAAPEPSCEEIRNPEKVSDILQKVSGWWSGKPSGKPTSQAKPNTP